MFEHWKRVEELDEVFIVRSARGTYAYAPLQHTSFAITLSCYESLQKGEAIAVRAVRERLDGKKPISIRDYSAVQSFEPHRVDLAITTRCNLACAYCHADSNSSIKEMDPNVAMAAVRFVIENAARKRVPYAQVGFNGGGEPTVNFGMITKVIEYSRRLASSLGTRVTFGMATNAAFSSTICDYVGENFSHIAVSLDGPPDIHDNQRPTVSGNGSCDIVFRNAKQLHLSEIRDFNIRATVSRSSVSRLEEIVRFFQAEFPRAGYSFMAINRLGRGADCAIEPPKSVEYIDAFVDILLVKKLCGLDKVFFMCGLLSTVRSTFCDAFSGPGFNVNVDGKLASCQRDNLPNEFYFGEIQTDGHISIDYESINRFRQPRITTERECIECFAKYNCGGECMDLVLHDQSRCDAIRHWTASQLDSLHLTYAQRLRS